VANSDAPASPVQYSNTLPGVVFPFDGRFSLCFTPDNGFTWHEQDSVRFPAMFAASMALRIALHCPEPSAGGLAYEYVRDDSLTFVPPFLLPLQRQTLC
jgi:hypothetical protein